MNGYNTIFLSHFTNGNNFYDFWFASLDKEVISKWGLFLKEFENLLLEEQIQFFLLKSKILFERGLGKAKNGTLLKKRICSKKSEFFP